ncbi:ATP synthase subunit I [Psychromonas aquatilis]|uniref:ATP synthase subunit I n=1 Tax=Psychromonas aquatilis TaxID=2005072 RepID=A0ABU9GTK4_9GAMM
MVDKLAKKGQISGLKMVAFQLLLVLSLALISTVFFSNQAGYSSLFGGITFLLPNFIFVWMAFAHAGARQSRKVLRGFYAGEAIKLFLTVLLLVVFLKFGALSLSAFYISFLLLVISQWLAPFFFYNNNGMKNDS